MELLPFVDDAHYWHWWILGLVLVALEMVLPGTFMVWMGVAAGLVGVLLLVFPGLGWQGQIATFAVLSLATVIVYRMWFHRHPEKSDQPNLNRRARQYVGRTFVLDEPIENGTGRIHVDDTYWRVRGTDMAAGRRVRVTGADGTILVVEPAEQGSG